MNVLLLILIVLGVVQGLAEFLPVSSSGHLVIIEQIHWIKSSLGDFGHNTLFLNVALHIATLFAVFVFLRKDIWEMIVDFFSSIKKKTYSSGEFKLPFYILVASIPAGIVGLLLNDIFEKLFSSIFTVSIFLIINGIILISTKKIKPKDRKLKEIGFVKSFIIGIFQSIAIIPGISRSGMTITGGLLNGIEPVDAFKFSFLISIPAIAGAGLLEGLKAIKHPLSGDLIIPLLIAMVVTFLAALVALKILLKFVKELKINVFGYYTLAVGIIALILVSIF